MEMKLYYVTNRNHEGNQWKPKGYGIHPSASGIENLRLGKVTLDAGIDSLDKWFRTKTGSGAGDGIALGDHLTKRAVEHANIIAYRERIPDPEQTEVTQKGTKLGSQEMFREVQETMREGRDILVYVHGFNVSWHSAVGSALALQSMLNRPNERARGKGDVLVILYTWPSDGSALPLVAYRSDRTEAIGSGFALGRGLLKLRDFLAETTRRLTKKEKEAGVQRDPCNQNVNLLCHSMGNYVLQNAIQRMVERTPSGPLPKIFDQVFLCAPDVDDTVLEAGQPLGRAHEIGRNVTVYFNEGDLALHGSDYTKGNPERLGTNGAANPNLLHQKIHQVNCSGDIVQGVLEHSYYLEGRINTDIRMSLDNLPREHSSRHPVKDDRFPNTFIMK